MSRGSRGAPRISAPLTRPSSASTSSSGTLSRRTESWSLRYVTMGDDPSAAAASPLNGIAGSVAAGRAGRNANRSARPNLPPDRRPRLGGGNAVDGDGLKDQVLVVAHVPPDQDHVRSPSTPRVNGGPGRIRPADGDLDRVSTCRDHLYPGRLVVEPVGMRIRVRPPR